MEGYNLFLLKSDMRHLFFWLNLSSTFSFPPVPDFPNYIKFLRAGIRLIYFQMGLPRHSLGVIWPGTKALSDPKLFSSPATTSEYQNPKALETVVVSR